MQDFQPATADGLAIARPKHRVRAMHHGHLLTDTDEAVVVRQEGQPDRYFFPLRGVGMESLVPTDFVREVPGYGEARFYTLHRDRSIIEHAGWSFERLADGLDDLSGYITFDVDVVQIEEDDDVSAASDRAWDAETQRMSDYIRHTDSGSGRSQGEPWSPTVGLSSNDPAIDDDDTDEDAFSRGSPT